MDADKLREIGHKIAKMEGGEKDGVFVTQMALRLARCESAMNMAVEIIDRNLHHQREKVVDASAILKDALRK